MLTCIACTKHLNNGSLRQPDDENDIETPRTKQAIKAIASQIKDMAMKASGAYKTCKPCPGSSMEKLNQNYTESDTASDAARFHCSYSRNWSSNSTPSLTVKEMKERVKRLSSGEATPVSVSERMETIVLMEEDEPKEWVAQVEPGVLITFFSLPQGGNDLKRIRFCRESFNKWQAQRWWAKNHDKVIELYNVQRFNHPPVHLPIPPRSKDKSLKIESDNDSLATRPLIDEQPSQNAHCQFGTGLSLSESFDPHQDQNRHCCDLGGIASIPKLGGPKTETSSMDGTVRTSSVREEDCSGEHSVSNASDMETEWIEEDEPGVYITIRVLPGGTRELRRVRFSRERFGEMHARLWWENNRARIQKEYL